MFVVERVEDFGNNTEIYSMGSIQEKVQCISQYNSDISDNIFLMVDPRMRVFDFVMFPPIFFVWTHQFKKQRYGLDFYQVELNWLMKREKLVEDVILSFS